ANRRTILPEALLCLDEIVQLATRVVTGMRVDTGRIAQNLRTYGPFAGTEPIMMEAVRAGGNRQELHELLRSSAMEAWGDIAQGKSNPLGRLLTEDQELTALVDPAEIRRMLEPGRHIGTAPARAIKLAEKIETLSPFPQQKEVKV
ncbi:MAG TPA: hypothetical protein VFL13_15275, partial [Candidatus Baltobacteraceae bacterium]|nr:hypothetical protein [Candidatus Baltobacteraceae bacterium]